MFDSAQHIDRFFHGRFVDGNGLETAFQRAVLLDILPVFVQGGGADDLHLSAGKRRLQNVCRVDTSLCLAGSDNVVNLVNDENDVARLLDIIDQTDHTRLKLTAELCSRHQSGHIDQINLLSAQFVRNVTGRGADGKRLGNCGLSDARFTDQAGVVFLSSAKNLNHTGELPLPAHNPVQLPCLGIGGQISAIGVQNFVGFLFLVLLGICAGNTRSGCLLCGKVIFLRRRMVGRIGGIRILHQAEISHDCRQINSGRSAVFVVIAVGRCLCIQIIDQLTFHIFKLFRRDPQFSVYVSQHTVYRRSHLFRAFDAETAADALSVFDSCYEYHCQPFVAVGTHHHIVHVCITPLFSHRYPGPESTTGFLLY